MNNNISYELLNEFPTHTEALKEIQRLRTICAIVQDWIGHSQTCAYLLFRKDCDCGLSKIWTTLEHANL